MATGSISSLNDPLSPLGAKEEGILESFFNFLSHFSYDKGKELIVSRLTVGVVFINPINTITFRVNRKYELNVGIVVINQINIITFRVNRKYELTVGVVNKLNFLQYNKTVTLSKGTSI